MFLLAYLKLLLLLVLCWFQGTHDSQFAGKPVNLDFHLLSPMPPTQAATSTSDIPATNTGETGASATQEGILAEGTLGVEFDWLANQVCTLLINVSPPVYCLLCSLQSCHI
jgi:hypothetical protein